MSEHLKEIATEVASGRMLYWYATVPVGIRAVIGSRSPTTSRCCPCRPIRRN